MSGLYHTCSLGAVLRGSRGPAWLPHQRARPQRPARRHITVAPVVAGANPRGRAPVINDKYVRDAKKAGYVSRAAYKLQEIQQRFRVVRPGGRVLDLGCFPGSWMQVACEALGPPKRKGLLVGIDLKATPKPPRVDSRARILQGDAFEYGAVQLLAMSPSGFTTVLSDMCPDTSGNVALDVGGSLSVASRALALATGPLPEEWAHNYGGLDPVSAGDGDMGDMFSEGVSFHPDDLALLTGSHIRPEDGVLVSGGNFVAKILEGEGFPEFLGIVKQRFKKVKAIRPKATRSMSREVFVVAMERKGGAPARPPKKGGGDGGSEAPQSA
ncbi:unnamed protein product [Pedinophyceae sp. YPF-701]|nr:unnamed protein product [Pedinophyceae sp. YPF-701]